MHMSKCTIRRPSGCVKKAILLSDDNMFEVHLMIDSLMLEKWVLTEIQLGLQVSIASILCLHTHVCVVSDHEPMILCPQSTVNS